MTTMTTTTAVTNYSAQVRNQLAGLDSQVIDELTGGLEADLLEALTDRVDPDHVSELPAEDIGARFGSPAAYAAELCEAAGITLPAPAERSAGHRDWLRLARAQTVARWEHFTGRPTGKVAELVLDSVRLLWWVLRAWVLTTTIGLFTGEIDPFRRAILPTTFVLWLVFLAMLTLSVQWGRQRIGQSRGWRRTGLMISALAVLLGLIQLPMLPYSGAWSTNAEMWSAADPAAMDHAYQNGYAAGAATESADGVGGGEQEVENLFVFDTEGNPVEGAQIVDQDGEPVILQPDEGDWRHGAAERSTVPVPLGAFDQTVPLNAYPYATIAPSQVTLLGNGTWDWNETAVEEPRWPDYERAAGGQQGAQTNDNAAGSEPTDEG